MNFWLHNLVSETHRVSRGAEENIEPGPFNRWARRTAQVRALRKQPFGYEGVREKSSQAPFNSWNDVA